MIVLKTRFDGEKIITPTELAGRPPREVVVVYEEPVGGSGAPSLLDFAGKAPVLRTAEDIDRQIRDEREYWGDR